MFLCLAVGNGIALFLKSWKLETVGSSYNDKKVIILSFSRNLSVVNMYN